ncbi:helix-turn-helix transcriptional regulator [Salmonella enterica subsp. enterica]|nr:AraC family transcriptional regulator [Salmonella enterica subsp. enterica]EDW9589376.1 helix-turn-helix transcriptional regulator [Salmonella enterica subsp. enterica]EED9676013.1 helix-turn-helix transcriptional regulator [Salmonella enterica subsp. enterica]EIO7472011.1 helix-turn-helix transcriptional regulator [Salmonella enterica subsp. enterica]EIY5768788.1 helix-turn-helix transcriptional regulator [Salmonella enterica subsp. enterica]
MFEKSLDWIENNLNKNISISNLAINAGCSERYLRYWFKKNTGMNPSEYITKRKLTQAAFMLKVTSRPVTDISLMFGFEHQTTFSRSFKKFTGMSPQKYRTSERWNMNYFCPSQTARDTPCFIKYVFFKEKKMIILRKKTFHINFGTDFLTYNVNKLLFPRKGSFDFIIDFIFNNNRAGDIIIYGELYPGTDCDTILKVWSGNIIDSGHINHDIIDICDGDYICFTFSGTPDELMTYHAWARGHGLHKYGVIQRNNFSLASFQPGPENGIYISHYYLPCCLVRQT